MTTEGKIVVQDKGTIEFELFDETPNTTKNFATLAQEGFYDGTTFHRVIDDFVVQGGDPNTRTGNGRPGTGGPGYRIKCECYNAPKQYHERGVFSMAHSGRDTGGSQFFIVLSRDKTAHLDGKHTAFGKVTSGMDVLGNIRQGDVMESVKITNVSEKIKNKTLQKI